MELSQVFASNSRQKILRALSRTNKIGVTKLVEKTNSTYNELTRNLRILEKEDIITINRFDHRVNISLNYNNAKTRCLLKALKTLEDNRTSPLCTSSCP